MKDDLISRQAARRIIEDINTFVSGWWYSALEQIDELPTVEPSVSTMKIDIDKEHFNQVLEGCELTFAPSEIVRCKNCRWWKSPDGCLHWDGLVTTVANGFCHYGERKSDV